MSINLNVEIITIYIDIIYGGLIIIRIKIVLRGAYIFLDLVFSRLPGNGKENDVAVAPPAVALPLTARVLRHYFNQVGV